MSCNTFYSIQAVATPDNIKSIYWRMNRSFDTKGRDLEFYVDFSTDSLGGWEELNTGTPIIDQCVFVDSDKRRYNMVSDIWYRVRALLIDPNGIEPNIEIESQPCQVQGALSDKTYIIGKAILKGLYKKLKKGGGQQGFLLKRRIWGERCANCTDFDVETVINAHCPICYGTGIVGGYHEGIEFWVMPSLVRNRQRRPTELGTMDDYSINAECAAYPWIDAYDVWVDAKTNERFLIKAVSSVIELERKPIVLNLSMVKIANTDASMDIPIASPTETFENENVVTEELSPITDKFPVSDIEVIKSDQASEDKGWRRGLEGDDW